jgi:spermidine synthase
VTRARAGLVAGLAGFAVMSLELTAVRLLAPYFGDSAYVWTNVIGVILVALAAGAWWGGRMADREHGANRLRLLFLAAGVLVALVPLIARGLGGALLPQDLPLDAAMPALVRGSLVASLILFAPAVGLLGCVTPMLITVLAAQDGKVGRASGLVAASSTLGSLLGTFATTHVLVPDLGSRITVWLCAALLVICSALMGRGTRTVLVLALPIGLGLVSWGPMRNPLPPDQPGVNVELEAEVESPYQYLQVLRQTDQEGSPALTILKINEGLDSFHSVSLAGSAFTDGRYYDYHAVVPFLAGDGQRPEPLAVLSLGDAAGSFNRLYAHTHPRCTVDAVELDAAVVQLGEQFFGGRPAPGRMFAGVDARVFVERSRERYDVVLVDAYEHQVYIPAHVASIEFFTAVRQRLREGGVVSINVGGLDFDDPVVAGLGQTVAAVFGESWAFHIPYSRNFMLLGRRDHPLDPAVLRGIQVADPELQEILDRTAAEQGWKSFSPGDRELVLVDDRPLLDELLDRSGYGGANPPDLTTISGERDPGEVGTEAQARLAADNPRGALAAVSSALEATAYLRVLAGDARWSLGDLRGALAEYRAAEHAGVQGAVKDYLQRQMKDCEEGVASRDRARSIATRNGWLAFAVVLALAAAFFAVLRRS